MNTQYVPVMNITIGNGKGMHRFITTKSYTQRTLESCAITKWQIKHYFTTDKK
jgi:hypothetical protein